jgi:hypothetical protein
MTRPYVGIRKTSHFREVFHSTETPTQQTHGGVYSYVIGPFRTLRGAGYMARYGSNNPHLQTVDDAENAAKKEEKTQ